MKRTLLQLRTEILALKTMRHANILELLQVELDAVYVKKSGLQVGGWVGERASVYWRCVYIDMYITSTSRGCRWVGVGVHGLWAQSMDLCVCVH